LRFLKTAWYLLRETFREWRKDNAMDLGAALAFYTVFSLAPLLIIVIAIAGLVFGPAAARGRIFSQFGDLVGPAAADQIQTMVESAWQPKASIIAGAIGLVTLILGAMGVFGALKTALNIVWQAQPREVRGIWGLLRGQILSLAMILGIAFLLLVSLVVSAGLAGLGAWAGSILHVPSAALYAVNLLVSLAVTAVLFAMMYRGLPDVSIAWRDVWVGAVVTAVLFSIGKEAIGLYLGRSSIASVYGAAGSLAVLLVWVYYSAAIMLFGAEFTEIFSRRHGSRTARGGVRAGR
jgi:membrane protein